MEGWQGPTKGRRRLQTEVAKSTGGASRSSCHSQERLGDQSREGTGSRGPEETPEQREEVATQTVGDESRGSRGHHGTTTTESNDLVGTREKAPSTIPRIDLDARDDKKVAASKPEAPSSEPSQWPNGQRKPSDQPRLNMLKSVDSWMLPVVINGVTTLALVDSGASATMISRAVYEKMTPGRHPLRPTRHDTVTGVGGGKVGLQGEIQAKIRISGH